MSPPPAYDDLSIAMGPDEPLAIEHHHMKMKMKENLKVKKTCRKLIQFSIF